MSRTVAIAPDSFKGSLSARDVAELIATGWRQERPDDELLLIPQADGGEGTLDAIETCVPAAVRHDLRNVTGPDGRATAGEWLELPGRVAVVELAQCSGLPLMVSLDPLGATSRGLGEVIRAALDNGAESLVIGLGGSASTDGGAGALAALGLGLFDEHGRPVVDGGKGLADIREIRMSTLVSAPPGGVTLLSDVTAPLLGPTGAAAVFGPQKGASPKQVVALEAALKHFAHLLGGDPGLAGSGAAGGTAFGFARVWHATITSGADYLANLSGLDAAIASADVLITGEGRFDDQSLGGKVVGQLLAKAAAVGTTTGVIAGELTADPGVWSVSLTELAGSAEAAKGHPAHWIRIAAAMAARALS